MANIIGQKIYDDVPKLYRQSSSPPIAYHGLIRADRGYRLKNSDSQDIYWGWDSRVRQNPMAFVATDILMGDANGWPEWMLAGW